MSNKIVHVVGGGTISHVRSHLALCSPAYGTAAKKIAQLVGEQCKTMDVKLHLTKMADSSSTIQSNDHLDYLVTQIINNPLSKIVFWTPAVVDFEGSINGISGKFSQRLETFDTSGEPVSYDMKMVPALKMVNRFRRGNKIQEGRKDIFLVACKQSAGLTAQAQYLAGLNLLKKSSSNLVLSNDTLSRRNMIIVPEEAVYHETFNRDEVLKNLVDMALLRSHLTFTRSTVVDGQPVPWDSELVPANLRAVVDYCINRGAYKKFLGVTAGHFAVKIDDTTFLTSRRKTDFNDMKTVGLVKVKTDGPDTVIAYGSKPSVGGQSQRIVFKDHPGTDCIVHFHCPIKTGSVVPVVSQRSYECGSHACGKNCSDGLKQFGNLRAVYLDQHGPNIVFSRTTDPQEVINFIEANFDLTAKTGGYQLQGA